MDDISEQLAQFRSASLVALFCLLSILLFVPSRSESHIKAINEASKAWTNDTLIFGQDQQPEETQAATLSVCPNVPIEQMVNITQGHEGDEIPRNMSTFYKKLTEHYEKLFFLRGANALAFNVRTEWNVLVFASYLELGPLVGSHLVTLELSNATVTEIQDALTFAWLPSFEKGNWTATHVEIVQIDDDRPFFSANGSPVMRIVYTLPVSPAAIPTNFTKLPSAYPWIFARNTTYHELPRIPLPAREEFCQRLRSKGLTVYLGPVFSGSFNAGRGQLYLGINSSSGKFDTDLLPQDLLGQVRQARMEEGCGDADMGDVQIHFSPFATWIAPMRENGSFFEIKVMPLQFKLFVKQKALVYKSINLTPLANDTDRYYARLDSAGDGEVFPSNARFIETAPLNPLHSFRMHLDHSMAIQLLPMLETAMAARLNEEFQKTWKNDTGFDYDRHWVTVHLWNFDPDGWVINFFVTLHKHGFYINLDARLPYANNIYRKLNGLQLPTAKFVYTLTNSPLPSLLKETIKSVTLQKCDTEKDLYFDEDTLCPLKSAFTLYVEPVKPLRSRTHSLVNGWKVETLSPDQILEAVQQAFAAANPVTMDDMTLTLTLTEWRDGWKTVNGGDTSRFYFALSTPKTKSGSYWRLWRYPTFDGLNKFLNITAKARIVDTWTVAY
ncbi:uncharacterized protein LOC129601807 [Paramacrobiotus metropolitanus]|uniref:uncharacterized protein LOC129601807 n=1 Tax=Paramacrobiotus metropolitanus TaxID=2943436 RepID=UPI002445BE07|nr:uncharacterized protein LOC129601807 [Paramacrobiotus metropolitanus]